MGFEIWLKGGKIRALKDVFGQGVPEGTGSDAEGSVTPSPVLGSKKWREEVCFGGMETTGLCVGGEAGR